MVLGLTGRCSAGKSEAARILESWDIPSVDADREGHRVLENSQSKLIELFGPRAVVAGRVDRAWLRQIIFSKPEKRVALEGIVHPEVYRICRDFVESRRGELVVVNAALLKRGNLEQLCDRILFIDAPVEIRCQRACKRDGIEPELFYKREQAQADISPGLFVKPVTVVNNSGSVSEFVDKLKCVMVGLKNTRMEI